MQGPLETAKITPPEAPVQPLAPAPTEQAPTAPAPLAPVIEGKQPAVVVPPVQPEAPLDEVQDFLVNNFESLANMGLEAYEAQDLSTVVFNPSIVSQKQIAEAEAAGTLAQLVNPEMVTDPFSGEGQESGDPFMGTPETASEPAAEEPAPSPAAPAKATPPPPPVPLVKVPASTSTALAKARIRNLGAGPAPAGIKPNPILSQVGKRAI